MKAEVRTQTNGIEVIGYEVAIIHDGDPFIFMAHFFPLESDAYYVAEQFNNALKDHVLKSMEGM